MVGLLDDLGGTVSSALPVIFVVGLIFQRDILGFKRVFGSTVVLVMKPELVEALLGKAVIRCEGLVHGLRVALNNGARVVYGNLGFVYRGGFVIHLSAPCCGPSSCNLHK